MPMIDDEKNVIFPTTWRAKWATPCEATGSPMLFKKGPDGSAAVDKHELTEHEKVHKTGSKKALKFLQENSYKW
ncbi:unnamed protein product [Nippostrongylus brasiliensis]|uniref:Phage protein n=1 Tax=Nippostrongylus brasiliensis TaxID=27835 RepID=A0A0N4YP15_NIPBR|nr:unnamed protein product [Nippostrongylus brasiliensis]